ncbi:putative F-box/FBD/LRR-repeat protein [Nymphaea thermarum]|nr:putative F-box/FBD/LRR-repeat protein [Nymphaea thermarum]
MGGSNFDPVEDEKKQGNHILMLSGLPNDIIAAILSSIPTELAVDASLLSQACRDLWTLVTVVDLDQTPTRSWLSKEESYSDYVNDPVALHTRRHRLGCSRKKKIAAIMEKYMQLHEDCITRFKLKFTTNETFDPLVDRWLQFVVGRKAKELNLDLRAPKWNDSVHRYRLPTDLFSFAFSLQVLTLRGCMVEPSFSFHSLCNLKKVVLDEVEEISVDMVQPLFLKTEFLTLKKLVVKGGTMSSNGQTTIVNEKMKGLKIVECSGLWLEECEIDAPNLQKFKYKGEVVNFSLRSVPPNLKKAAIIVNKELGVNNAFRRLINQVCCVKYLTLGFSVNFTGIHSRGEQENEISLKPFLYLKELQIITGGVDVHERTANCLIKNAPRLKKYNVYPEFMVSEEKIGIQWERFLLSEFM